MRHRGRPRPAPQPEAAPPPAPPARPPTPAPPPGPPIESHPIQLHNVQPPPAPAAPPRPTPAPRPAPEPQPAPISQPAQPGGGSTSLDLDAPTATPAARRPPATPIPPAWRPPLARASRTAVTLLTPTQPTVTLDRRQSAIGTLLIEAVCSESVGDLRLGCAYQLTDGTTSVVSASAGQQAAPPRSARPVIVGGHEQFEQIEVDLRQVQRLERLLVFAFSWTGAPLAWGGTLRTTTFGGAVVEMTMAPEQAPVAPVVLALLSVYDVAGELSLRAESEVLGPSIREACLAYGYERITWLDDRSPAD